MLKTAILSAALLAAAVPGVRAQSAGRAAVEAFYTQVINGTGAADLAQRAERGLAPNWESEGDCSGRNKTRAEFAAALPDLRWEIVEILQQGGRFAVRGRAQATPARPFFGVEPSGKRFDIMSIDIHTVENGRIVRSCHVEDWAGALRQLRAR